MFLLVCLLFFSTLHPQDNPAPIIAIDSLQSLRGTVIDFEAGVPRVQIDDGVMAHAMHQFIFPYDNDATVIDMIKDRLVQIKGNNPPSYNNITFYMLYKASKANFKDPSVTDVNERLYSTKHEDLKDSNWVAFKMAKMYVKLITQESYQDYLYEKDKDRKRALICATIRAGALFPVLPKPIKRRRSDG